jgi:tellurite resistance protein TehA-like permease
MGTGIVSIALLLDRRMVLSTILLVICAIIWLALAVLLPARALRDGRRFAVDLRQPAALTSIAGTGVLGTRLTLAGWRWAGVALLIIALAVWLGLVGRVLRPWQMPTVGASFILTVATDSLALLAAMLAFAERAGWLVYAALAPLALALSFYAFVLSRFQFRQLAVGMGDHWVTGGALAISTIAVGRIVLAAQHTGTLSGGHAALKTLALVLWCLTMAWLPALIIAELARPRLRYSVRRWSTVFPVGMYAACSFTVGALTKIGGITTFAQVWVWVAVIVWLLTLGAMLRRTPDLTRGGERTAEAAPSAR